MKRLLAALLLIVTACCASAGEHSVLVYCGLNAESKAEVLRKADRLKDRFDIECVTFRNAVVVQAAQSHFRSRHMGLIRKYVYSGDVIRPLENPPLKAKAEYTYVAFGGERTRGASYVEADDLNRFYGEILPGSDASNLRDFVLLCQKTPDSPAMVRFLIQNEELVRHGMMINLNEEDHFLVSVTAISIQAENNVLATYNVYNDCTIKRSDVIRH